MFKIFWKGFYVWLCLLLTWNLLGYILGIDKKTF